MEELFGGRQGSIYRSEDGVVRPLNRWSPTIHLLLKHLELKGVAGCPKFLTQDGERELLSYVEGDTYNYPLTGSIASEAALTSAAALLKSIHDATANFIDSYPQHDFRWMLPALEPFEVICHGDFTPYNVALSGDSVVGVFDFDTAHPAPRVWDLAFSVYCWAPFKTDPTDASGSFQDQITRARQFCDSYGATLEHRKLLVQMMVKRLTALVNFMRNEAASGNEQFSANMEQGHHLIYLRDIEYLSQYQGEITQGLLSQTQHP